MTYARVLNYEQMVLQIAETSNFTPRVQASDDTGVQQERINCIYDMTKSEYWQKWQKL